MSSHPTRFAFPNWASNVRLPSNDVMTATRITLLWMILNLALFETRAGADEPPPVSFRNDVMAVLSKAGCNAGTCHGNQNGKGGFKLSLRGDDPEGDFRKLTRDVWGRRGNSLDAPASLLLRKPTMVIPHEGGRRFLPGDLEYAILERWIADGMRDDPPSAPKLVNLDVEPAAVLLRDPESEFRIRATATFSDGSRRDVTRLAVFEPAEPIVDVARDGLARRAGFGETTVIVRYLEHKRPVRVIAIPESESFVWTGPEPTNFIDRHVFDKLQRLRVNPSGVCDDATFLRRTSLDLLGIPPTAAEARTFADDDAPDKRARWIDHLLERQEFADHWALKWSDLLRNEEKVLDRKGVRNLHSWLRDAFANNKPFDQLVRELISARGSTYLNPPANFWRAMRDPQTRAESTAQLFLGVRLQCAKCHNHPFDRWTQNDYYAWTNLFAQVEYRVLSNNRRDNNDQHEFDGEQLVVFTGNDSVAHPATGKVPEVRFLGAETPRIADRRERLPRLAEWIASSDNRRFVESQANRLWYQVMGVGIVDPIDDFRETNPASHPELLRELGDEFVRSGFDVKHLLRTILNSRTYQLSSRPTDENRDHERNFAFAKVKRLSAEQIVDAIVVATGARTTFRGYPADTRAGEISGVRAMRDREGTQTSSEQFLARWGKPERLQTCECERSDEANLSQIMLLISGGFLHELIGQAGGLVDRLLDAEIGEEEIAERLYWSILSRPPGDAERRELAAYFRSAPARRSALEDAVWALVNVKEFLFRH